MNFKKLTNLRDYSPHINDVNIKKEVEEIQKLIDICKEGLYRWKGGLGFMQTATLPDGITKRDIRRRMIEKPSAKSIINKMKPGFYDEKTPPYYNITRFMDEISKKNQWVELWNEIK